MTDPADGIATDALDSVPVDDVDDSIGATFARLADSGKAYAAAEIERQKLRAGLIGAGVRDVTIFAVLALMLVFAAVVALLVGIVIALAPLLGPLGAAGAVFGGTLLLVVILLFLAYARIRRLTRELKA